MPLKKISENLFLLQSDDFSCNSFLLKGEKNLLIDTGINYISSEHKKMLFSLNLKPEDINVILHTHNHYDHFEADKIYSKAEIFMSKSDAENLNKKAFTFSSEKFIPKINFLTEKPIQNPPFQLQVIPTPGHTIGSVCFYEKEKKMLFSGDTVFFQGIGRTDFPSGSFSELKDSIQKLSELEIEFIFPGHGRIVSGSKAVKENFDFIKENFF